MLSEFAVEPATIGAEWSTFLYLSEKFGADKGRIISRLPSKWERKVVKAAKDAGIPNIRVSSIVERLRSAKHKIGDFNRIYNHEASWIDNAVREHGKKPFRAIISSGDAKLCPEALPPDDCSDEHPLFNAPISQDVARTPDDIAGALVLLAAFAEEIDIVDPYFDSRPGKGDYIGPLKSLLARLASLAVRPKVIRVHFGTHISRPPPEILARDAPDQTRGLLPQGYCLELHEWSEVQGGEDFHDRFFLTEVGGLMIGAGFSAEGPAKTATFTLLDVEHAQRLRSRFSATSSVYNRVGSVVRIYSDGRTELL
ncbi:MAG: hypothetical protein OXC26_04435 [Albidovulum sp.]|nr:hypothetical protein [Albidovulum sp.]